MYRSALQAGRIIASGTATTDPVADDPLKPIYRLYCVRPDVNPKTSFESVHGILSEEAALIARFDSVTTAQSLYVQYISDWNEWPARTAVDPGELAPFTDINGDGLYDPAVDVPGQPGADQMLYYVANDVNASLTNSFYGSPPIGLEMHKTIWGYARFAALNQTIFSSTLLINKSGAPVDSMFLVQWSDCDLGDAGDDFVGCDTVRGLGYTYNGREIDARYGRTVLSGLGVLLPGQTPYQVSPLPVPCRSLARGSFRTTPTMMDRQTRARTFATGSRLPMGRLFP